MTTTPTSSDNQEEKTTGLRKRKQKSIIPLGKAATRSDSTLHRAKEEMLNELRQKTAILASKMNSEKKIQIEPTADQATEHTNNAQSARSIIRNKLEKIYSNEPSAELEIQSLKDHVPNVSKHQEYMRKLMASGASIVEIQTKWHTYYVNLPEHEKHEVWQEFYDSRNHLSDQATSTPKHVQRKRRRPIHPPKHHVSKAANRSFSISNHDTRSSKDIRKQIIDRINADGALTLKHHVKSLFFGLSMSALILVITSFIFFNEAFVAPFISPGRTVSATPIIGPQTTEIGSEPKIVIPKINLEVPLVFDLQSIEEQDIQDALEAGVVHYATTPKPGEIGNSVIVGHSSNNIFNQGKYKFAFVLLNRLEAEDTFFVHRDGVRYTYKVYRKEVVSPNAISVLDTQDRPHTMTLITCDPPGTSINRLIIVAEQISPDPAGNTVSSAQIELEPTDALPSNAPSLWSRIWPF